MAKARWLDMRVAFAIYAGLDVVCVGMGMGVPILCILLGFPVGWYLGAREAAEAPSPRHALARILRGAAVTSAFTFVMMAASWGRCGVMLLDPAADLANFGIPMVLFTPRASFIGWLVLMIFLSPFFQFLATLFSGQVALMRGMEGE